MTCDLCGEKEATVHLTEIIDDESRELHLCEPCAREKGTGAAEEFGLAGLLAGLTDFGIKPSSKKPKPPCAQCGLTYEAFRKSGRLGCAACYRTFGSLLSPLLKRIHGSTQHVGHVPPVATRKVKSKKAAPPADDLVGLKEQLKAAVADEAFEQAAKLRDQIRILQAKRKKQTPS